MKFGSWRTFRILKVTRMLLYLWRPKSFLHFFNICCIVIFQVIHSCKRRIVSKKLENLSCLPVSHKNRSAFWGYLVVAAGERWSQWHSSLLFWFERRSTFARIIADLLLQVCAAGKSFGNTKLLQNDEHSWWMLILCICSSNYDDENNNNFLCFKK
jgi:hypothetical protein